ncbi:MAG: hypothetical protein JJU36_11695 [Phycisphaeraceae bacterium]|nr:hypothetical protein [Phycisphaeraceae bacterium]
MDQRTESSTDQKNRRWPRRLGIGVVVLVGVLIITFAGVRLWAELDLYLAGQAVRAAGLPVNLDEARVLFAIERSGRDGTELYEKAFKLVRGPDEVQLLPSLGSGMFGSIADSDVPEPIIHEARQFIDASEEAIELLIKAGQADFGNIDRHIGAQEDASSDRLRQVRSAAHLLRLALDVALIDGEEDRALELSRSLVRLGDALGDDPSLVLYMVRCSIYSMAFERLGDVLSVVEITEARLDRIEAGLREIDPVTQFRNSMVTAHLETREHLPANLVELAGTRGRLMNWRGATARQQAEILRRLIDAHQRAERPIEQWMRVEGPPPFEVGLVDRMTEAYLLSPASTQSFASAARCEAHRRAALIAVAIERFRLREGRVPEQLASLSPDILAEIPVNSIGDEFELEHLTDGYWIGFSRKRMAKEDDPGFGRPERDERNRLRVVPIEMDFRTPDPAPVRVGIRVRTDGSPKRPN